MGAAWINRIEDPDARALVILDNAGVERLYDRGQQVSDPPSVNADITWNAEAQARYEVKFAGDDLPDKLIVKAHPPRGVRVTDPTCLFEFTARK